MTVALESIVYYAENCFYESTSMGLIVRGISAEQQDFDYIFVLA